jgi:hypothetical protein
MLHDNVVSSTSILYHHTLNIEQGVMILLYKVFYKGKYNFISLGKFIFILLLGIKSIDPSKDKGEVYIINGHRGKKNNFNGKPPKV